MIRPHRFFIHLSSWLLAFGIVWLLHHKRIGLVLLLLIALAVECRQ